MQIHTVANGAPRRFCMRHSDFLARSRPI